MTNAPTWPDPTTMISWLAVSLLALTTPNPAHGQAATSSDRTAIEPIRPAEITEYGVEEVRATAIADSFNVVLDRLPDLPRYDELRPHMDDPSTRWTLYFGMLSPIRNGLPRLSTEDHWSWSLVKFKMFDALQDDPKRCARLSTLEDIDGQFLAEVYNTLELEHVRLMAGLQARALVAGLEAEGPLPQPTEEDAALALRKLLEEAGKDASGLLAFKAREDADRLKIVFNQRYIHQRRLAAADECFFAYEVWNMFPNLGSQDRRTLLRFYW